MRIGFDVSQTAEQRAGCGVFQAELFSALARVSAERDDVTLVPIPVFSHYRHPDYRQALRVEGRHVDPQLFDLSFAQLAAAWDAPGPQAPRLGQVDVVHSNSFGCPKHLGVPLVYTVYDLSPLDHPEYHTEANRLACFTGLFDASLRADAFIAISAFTRDRFLHWFPHVDPAEVVVVHPAARAAIRDAPHDAAAVLASHGLSSAGFFLAVGTVEPRKNYSFIIECYLDLLKTMPDLPPLCIAGQRGWLEGDIAEKVRGTPAAQRIRTLGFIPDHELATLYQEATAVLFASHYEGFGLPLVEALASGAAVIATRTSTIPEVLDDAGIIVTHGDHAAWIASTRLLATDASMRATLGAQALARAKAFSWASAAGMVMDVYQQTVRRCADAR